MTNKIRPYARLFAALLIFTAALLCAVSCKNGGDAKENDGRLKIVTTVFPPYDFARQIAGENADIAILLPPGSEMHTFEPTPSNIIAVEGCDLFLYIGGENEQWAEKMLQSSDSGRLKAVKLIDTVSLLKEDDADEYDQHIWTSPANAKLMLNVICTAICEADPDNADIYRKNAENYSKEISALESDIRAAVEGAANTTVIFADKFPFRYFADEFGLSCLAAFPGCSDESEPSAAAMKNLIETVKAKNIKVVYYLEFSSRKTADIICDQTGADALMLHSCHNVSKEDLDNGATYVSLMRQNLENLKACLN